MKYRAPVIMKRMVKTMNITTIMANMIIGTIIGMDTMAKIINGEDTRGRILRRLHPTRTTGTTC